MKILLYCQHLLGVGHYVRSMAVAAGLYEHTVFFVNGGAAIPGISVPEHVRMLQMPPMKTDEDFKLLDTDTHKEVRQWRKEALLQLYDEVQPEVIIIELFPFGRKKFAFELIPLLETNHQKARRTYVVCSLRDILVAKENQAKFEDRVCHFVNRYFDSILVHSDEQIHSLRSSFSRVSDLEAQIHYTGYVIPQNGNGPLKPFRQDKLSECVRITISAGGGRVGFPLLKTAIQAKQCLDSAMPVELNLITGPFLSQPQRWQLDLMTSDDPCVRIETFVPNLCHWLKNSDVSVSMAGYNTCLDILQAGVPAVLVPFNGGGNDEQLRRAQALAEKGVATLLPPEELNPENLACAIKKTLETKPKSLEMNLSGVENTRRYINQADPCSSGGRSPKPGNIIPN